MHNTGSEKSNEILPDGAIGYKVWGNYVHADYLDMSIMTGAGGLYSTVEDLHLWDRVFFSDKLLTLESRELMMTPQVAVNSKTSYGYGLNITNEGILKNSLQTHKVIGLSGAIDGFMAEHQRFINEELSIFVLSNVHPSQPSVIVKDVARIVLGEEVPIPLLPEYITVDQTQYENFIGKYSTNKFNHQIVIEDSKLYIVCDPWYKYELQHVRVFPTHENSLFRTVGAAGELEIFHNEVGRAEKVQFRLFSKTMDLRKSLT